MTNTEKILAEFDKEFGDVWKIIEHTVGQLPKLSRRNREIKDFITTAIAQAPAEDRERVGGSDKIYEIAVEVIGDVDKPKEIAIHIYMEKNYKTIRYVPTVQLIPGSFGFRYGGRDLTNKDKLSDKE